MRRPPLLALLLVAASLIVVGGTVLAADEYERRLASSPEAGPATASPSPSPGTTPSASASPSTAAQSADASGSASGDEPRSLERVFPVAGCKADYARTHHDYPAADVFADRGCRFVAPVAGYVDEVVRKDTWDSETNRGEDRGGLSVSIVGDDGVRYYGSHLAAIAPGIGPGVVVEAGRILGRIGDSGSARGTGSHVHFGISWPSPPGRWWIRRGVVAPQPYLDAWRGGRARSPAQEVARAERRYGDDTTCRDYC